MDFDNTRRQKIFTSQELCDASERVYNLFKSELLHCCDDETTSAALVLWTLAGFMVNLGINGPDDYYEP